MKKGSASNQASPLIVVLLVVLFLSIGAMIANFWYINTESNNDKQYISYAGELRVLSQKIATNATKAVAGKAEAFTELSKARDAFKVSYEKIVNGDPEAMLPMVSNQYTTVSEPIDRLKKTWREVNENTGNILDKKNTVLNLHKVAENLAKTIPQLQSEYDKVIEILLNNNAPAEQIAVATRQSWLAERIVRSVNVVLKGGGDSKTVVDRFQKDVMLFGSVLNGMLNGSVSTDITRVTDTAAIDRLLEIDRLFSMVSDSAGKIMDSSDQLIEVRNASNKIFADSQLLLDETTKLQTVFGKLANERLFSETSAVALGLVAVIMIILIGLVLVKETRKRLQESASQNEANQAAILRLLDELADLADGDLRVSATVTEDFTGAIADSINFSIEQLRSLVTTINKTAVQVSSAAHETQATAIHLAEASEHQAQEIAGASAAVNEMAVSIDQVSSNASESAGVAERSVQIANKGNEIVQNTISGMDNIREQIQDTSKRIKRLGESSQEIGDIVSLINDIADQTNILALNAAIQASMAGDAGRGFAVVADEVQRLAERSSAATKQIEALVKTIQTDTNEAVISMEQTTSEVVRGAHLAQDAGIALEDIETVSQSLAELIQNISNAARQQASSAGHISNTMNVIQEITSQTSSGTTATAKSIGNLAEMATSMQNSVAGFKLPA